MMNDTVREELQTKIAPMLPPRFERKAEPATQSKPAAAPPRTVEPPIRRPETSGLTAPKTSPTLVEFQSKSATLPDWRLQLQNAVQQRKGNRTDGSAIAASDEGQTHYRSNGGAALKAETAPNAEPAAGLENMDPRVVNAMRRIDDSRKTFLPDESDASVKTDPRSSQNRSFPFNVVSPTSGTSAAAAPAKAAINPPPKPKLVSSPPVEKKFDTNKLPPIQLRKSASEEIPRVELLGVNSDTLPTEFSHINRIRIKAEAIGEEDVERPEVLDDEIEDLAPFSMRFNAALFDLIIGAFASMLLLSPLAFTGSNWFSTAGLLTFAATWAIVLFVYMTACVGFFGKTLGMRLFSLELVDAVENEYPTLHQAAVNSSVFLLSIALGGAGFLTVFFNEENRALHDLLSGTIIVKEF